MVLSPQPQRHVRRAGCCRSLSACCSCNPRHPGPRAREQRTCGRTRTQPRQHAGVITTGSRSPRAQARVAAVLPQTAATTREHNTQQPRACSRRGDAGGATFVPHASTMTAGTVKHKLGVCGEHPGTRHQHNSEHQINNECRVHATTAAHPATLDAHTQETTKSTRNTRAGRAQLRGATLTRTISLTLVRSAASSSAFGGADPESGADTAHSARNHHIITAPKQRPRYAPHGELQLHCGRVPATHTWQASLPR